MNIKEIFDNENNVYYGHGTGTTSLSVINSIMNNGLRCSHESLYFTSVALCMGNNVDDKIISLMKNWPHKNSQIIIIVSLPIKYIIIDSISIGTYNCANSAYYYVPSIESREKYRLTESNYVMPEFIKGYYDSLNDRFVSNPKYYEFLSFDEQKKIFEKVKFNYITVINNTCGIKKYREIIESLDMGEFPLTDEDIENVKKRSN